MADLPPHAYIPGRTTRHSESLFDEIKASVTNDVPIQKLHQTEAFKSGLRYLHTGFNWECHEVLEAVWMQTHPGSPERAMTQALIQLANARLKLLMGKPRAVERLCGMVANHLADCPAEGTVMGLEVELVRDWLKQVEQELLVVPGAK